MKRLVPAISTKESKLKAGYNFKRQTAGVIPEERKHELLFGFEPKRMESSTFRHPYVLHFMEFDAGLRYRKYLNTLNRKKTSIQIPELGPLSLWFKSTLKK